MTELPDLADSCLLVPFAGTSAPDWVLRRLSGGLRGVTLFGHNIASPGQLRALTAQLRAARDDVLIAVDEEGGDVTRLDYATGSSYPGNCALGLIDDVTLTRAVARSIAGDLAAAGINLALAPVADVNSNALNPVIGVRSFGDDPHAVARHVRAFVEGLQGGGVLACAKHFPGHGDTVVDSHRGLPRERATRAELDAGALVPFRAAIDAGVAAVMTAHIVMDAYDDVPATVSPAVLTGLLRGELGYDGLVITDAVDMAGVTGSMGSADAAVRALIAGADLVCTGGGPTGEDVIDSMRDAIVSAVGEGRLPEARLVEAAERVGRAAERVRSWRARAATAAAERDRGDIGLLAARRAVRVEGAASPRLIAAPVVIELRTTTNAAVGTVPWGMGTALTARAPGTTVIACADTDPRAGDLAAAAGRPLILVYRDLARCDWARAAADAVVSARPDAICVDMGWPGADPAHASVVIRARGAGRVNAIAVAELLLPEVLP